MRTRFFDALPLRCLSALLALLPGIALASGVSPNITGLMAIGDPNTPSQQACVDASGHICTDADGVADAANVSATGAAAGVLSNTPTSTAGYAVVDVDVQSISASSITPAASFDNGTTYRQVQCTSLNANTAAVRQSFTATGQWECPAGDHFQLTQVGAGATTVALLKKRVSSNQNGGIQLGSNTATAIIGTPGDGQGSANSLGTESQELMFNGSNWDRRYYCNSSATVAVTAGNTTQIVALASSKVIRVCGFGVSIGTTGTYSWTSGTGTNCGSNTTALTGTMNLTAGTPFAVYGNPELFRTTTAYELCLVATTGNVNGWVSYAQY